MGHPLAREHDSTFVSRLETPRGASASSRMKTQRPSDWIIIVVVFAFDGNINTSVCLRVSVVCTCLNALVTSDMGTEKQDLGNTYFGQIPHVVLFSASEEKRVTKHSVQTSATVARSIRPSRVRTPTRSQHQHLFSAKNVGRSPFWLSKIHQHDT